VIAKPKNNNYMKITKIIAGIVSLTGATLAYAGSSADCTMMPGSSQNTRENLVWIGPVCCYPADNIKADVSSQNSRYALTNPAKSAQTIGKTTIVYSSRGEDVRESTIAVTR